jgi:hypothetical protein
LKAVHFFLEVVDLQPRAHRHPPLRETSREEAEKIARLQPIVVVRR